MGGRRLLDLGWGSALVRLLQRRGLGTGSGAEVSQVASSLRCLRLPGRRICCADLWCIADPSTEKELWFLQRSSWRCDLRVIPVLVCMMGFSTALVAQSNSVAGSVKVVPGDWERVKQLGPHTRVHLSTDRGSHLCSVD